ncbi:MAG TPA: hypothetical protein VFK79_00755, partial [Xanthobacteraceae bacterium]|nr:hypothetical protein [Xanthobacteraceae bacterium]
SFSRSNPMQVQVAASFDAMGLNKLTYGFWQPVGETMFYGVFLRLLSMGPLASRAEIYDVSHTWSELSSDA